MFGEVPQHCGARRVQPCGPVGGDAGLLYVGHQPPPFVVGHPIAGCGLDRRQVFGAHHPQRATHREVFDQRAALVEFGVQIGDAEAGQPCPQRQIRRGRVGGMEADEIPGHTVDRVRRPPAQEMPWCQARPPLVNRECPHSFRTVPVAPDEIWDR
jgi:hypothetical protein